MTGCTTAIVCGFTTNATSTALTRLLRHLTFVTTGTSGGSRLLNRGLPNWVIEVHRILV